MADDAAPSPSPSKKRKLSRTSTPSSHAPPPTATEASSAPSPAPSVRSSATPSPAAGGSSSAPVPRAFPAPSAPQSCAACRRAHRMCTPACPLARYFPGDQPEAFDKVWRLYGSKGLENLMKPVAPSCHVKFVSSIAWEADAWAVEPVHGPRGVIQHHEAMLRDAFVELHAIVIQLRTQEAQAQKQLPAQGHPPATQQRGYDNNNRSAAAHDQRTGAEISRDQSMAMSNAAPIGYNQHPQAHLTPAQRMANQLADGAARDHNVMMQQTAAAPTTANQYTNAGVVFPHGHGHPMSALGHQGAAAVEDAHAAPGNNSGVRLGAAPLGSAQAGAFVFHQQQQQQQPPPSRGSSGTASRYQPSPPPSP